jgi:hypothetical protein
MSKDSAGSKSAHPELYLKNNGAATFANLHLSEKNPMGNAKQVERDVKPYEGELPPLPPVKLAGVE